MKQEAAAKRGGLLFCAVWHCLPEGFRLFSGPVSYTHLTLPTIYSV